MADQPRKLSDSAHGVLTLAASRDDHLVRLPPLPIAAARQVIRSLLNGGLVEEIPALIADDKFTWRDDGDGSALMFRATAAGLARVGGKDGTGAATIDTEDEAAWTTDLPTGPDPDIGAAEDTAATSDTDPVAAHTALGAAAGETAEPTAATNMDVVDAAPVPPTRPNLRQAAQAALAAWNDETNRETDIIAALDVPMAVLQAALVERAPRGATNTPRAPRENTRQAQILALLRRPEGVSGPDIAGATGWASHTVRGFLAGLKKKGFTIETLERVRQIGPGKQGAKGGYSIYRIGEAG